MNLRPILRQIQKFNSAEGRFIRELKFDRCFEESGCGLSRRNNGFCPERMRKTMIVPERIADFSSQIQTRQLLKKKSEVFHPYQLARLDENLAKFNNSLILSYLEGLKQFQLTPFVTHYLSGFGGLGVACWPLVPNFAGSNTAEAVGFFRAKKVKPSVPCRRFAACKRSLK
jgi:hypothetical protein